MSGLRFKKVGGVACLTFDRSANANSIDMAMAQALRAAVQECSDDPEITCVTLTGEGRFFCAGGDVSAFAEQDDLPCFLRELADTLHDAVKIIAGMRKPFVTLVNGPAAGAGMSLALLGDLVLAAHSVHFTAAYTKIGLTPDGGMSWLLPRLVGLRQAQALSLTNRRVSANEAQSMGMVTMVFEDSMFVEESSRVVDELARTPIHAVGATKALLHDGFSRRLSEQLDAEAESISLAGGTEEARALIENLLNA